jgi:hypothetical protein
MTSDRARQVGKAILNLLLCCAAAGIIVQNISLIRQNRSLHRTVDRIAAQIEAGQKLSGDLTATGADGRLSSIPMPASAAEHLLIITFSPGCPACQANQDEWARLARGLQRRGWRVLWVSRDQMDTSVDYARKHQMSLSDVFGEPPYRTYLQLGLSRVPNTIEVAPGGVMQRVWPGQLADSQWKEMFAYFHVEEESPSSAAALR